MPADSLRTDLDVMSQVATKFNAQATDLQSQVDALMKQARAIEWSGAAAGAFSAATTEVEKAWTNLNNVLGEISSTINTQGQGFGDMDHSNATRVQNVTVPTSITARLSG